MQLNWTDPILLKNYSSAPKGAGLYVIGEPYNPLLPVTPSNVFDSYMGRWPDNLRAVYVGISESTKQGVRGRLSSHARSKGNKFVAGRIKAGGQMWFMTMSGLEFVEYEASFMCLKIFGQFEGNVREERERSAIRQINKYREEMGPSACAFYDDLDMGEHGEGM